MTSLKSIRLLVLLTLSMAPMHARDVILEFKGAYFLPTGSEFKHIYKHGGALFGPELTVQLCNNKNWYAFASIDYLQKTGHSLGLCDKTTVKILPLAVGLKYFIPVGCDRADLYVGLGFQPESVRTKDCLDSGVSKQSRWGFGGIAKAGTYINLPCKFVLDLFVDYSFVYASSGDKCNSSCSDALIPIKANLSGAIFGAGIGYRF